jgi:asparagine synthase (glutamine-hydrolysing)
MCGITGIFAFADSRKTWQPQSLDNMVSGLSHRGPDDHGIHVEPGLFLGHTRLSVIDLSKAGHQPMFTDNKIFVISYNGEIYNFKEIRKELEGTGHHFRSDSDTEVLLRAWQEWGESCLEKLDGIFAFAIYDRKEKKLFLVRDHMGVKPLFYMIDQGQIFFASELMALFGPLNPFPGYNDADLDAYFTFNYLCAPRSGVQGVYQLPPGCMLTVSCTEQMLTRYWKPTYKTKIEPWSYALIDRFKELLTVAVKRQLVSDAPLGLFLSGGVDSFAVALAAIAVGKYPAAFTMGFTEAKFNEVPAALQYAQHLKISSNISIFSWTEHEIYETLGAMKELLADASCFPVYQLSRFTREQVTVALAGDGADELLAGYDTYKAGEITPYIRMIPKVLRRSLNGMLQYLPLDNRRYGKRMIIERILNAADEGDGRDHVSFRRIFSQDMKKRLYNPDFFLNTEQQDPVGEYAKLMLEVPKERSYLTARQHADLIFHLPSILAKVDRMSMANGLEVRVPLLNRHMVEFCLNLPDVAKRCGSKGKRILRNAIADSTPRGSLSRPKAGFLPPVDQWFRGTGPMNNVFSDHLAIARTSLFYLQWDEVKKLWDEHRKGIVDAGFTLLGILQFINWNLHCKKCKNT